MSHFKQNILFFSLALMQLSAMAYDGAGGSNGGDANEKRFLEISGDIANWIQLGGAKRLHLPSNISTKNYNKKMLKVLDPHNTVIGFTDQPVLVNSVEKTCKNFVAKTGLLSSQMHITCNISRFEATSEADQYTLVHHEYAGLAGFEVNSNASSDYTISNQLAEFLEYKTVLRLGVKSDDADTKDDTSLGQIREFSEEQDKLACDGQFCKLLSVDLDKQGLIKDIIIDRATSESIKIYLKGMVNSTPGEENTYPEFTPAQQTMLLFYTSLIDLIGTNLGLSGPTSLPEKNMLATVVASNGGKNLTVFVDKSIYNTLKIYMSDMVNTTPGEENTYPQFTPAEQTMIMFYNAITTALKNNKLHGVMVSQEMHDLIATYMQNLIKANKEQNESRTYPQFTPAEQEILLLFTTLLQK